MVNSSHINMNDDERAAAIDEFNEASWKAATLPYRKRVMMKRSKVKHAATLRKEREARNVQRRTEKKRQRLQQANAIIEEEEYGKEEEQQ